MCEIIGAGMAGLLAANMLHKRQPVVFEAQDALPNNHHAVLRFRSSIVGDTVGIPFRKVQMLKCSHPWLNAVGDALAYSYKCTGIFRSDRSLPIGPVSQERYIAPSDFIAQMAKDVRIEFNHPVPAWWLKKNANETKIPIISTMPMPILMKLLDYQQGTMFNDSSIQGHVIRARVVDCDAYVSVYVPDPGLPFSRVSVTGDELIIELQKKPDDDFIRHWAADAVKLIGIPDGMLYDIELKEQKYFKILNVDDTERKRFIAWATDNFNVYSLGRFATWRPGLLLDDLVGDVRLIDKWISSSDNYAIKQHRVA